MIDPSPTRPGVINRPLKFAIGLALLLTPAVLAACSTSANGTGTAISASSSTAAQTSSAVSAGNAANVPATTVTATVSGSNPPSTSNSTSTSPSPSRSTTSSLSTAMSTPAPNLPDLTVKGMSITQDSPTHARVTFDAYNIGTVDVTQPFYVNVCIGTLCVEKQITLPVRAGGSTELFVDFNHPSSTTPETVTVMLDSHNEIQELREDNNSTTLNDVSLNY